MILNEHDINDLSISYNDFVEIMNSMVRADIDLVWFQWTLHLFTDNNLLIIVYK